MGPDIKQHVVDVVLLQAGKHSSKAGISHLLREKLNVGLDEQILKIVWTS